MDAPGGEAIVPVADSIAPPQALDEGGGRHSPADHVFLALLLLHLERETGAEDAGGQREK